jgi:hypothetical protein
MSQIEVRALTAEEIKRFEAAEANEEKIAKAYGRYSEHDSIQEGMWIMKVGRYSDLPVA